MMHLCSTRAPHPADARCVRESRLWTLIVPMLCVCEQMARRSQDDGDPGDAARVRAAAEMIRGLMFEPGLADCHVLVHEWLVEWAAREDCEFPHMARETAARIRDQLMEGYA